MKHICHFVTHSQFGESLLELLKIHYRFHYLGKFNVIPTPGHFATYPQYQGIYEQTEKHWTQDWSENCPFIHSLFPVLQSVPNPQEDFLFLDNEFSVIFSIIFEPGCLHAIKWSTITLIYDIKYPMLSTTFTWLETTFIYLHFI